MITALRTFYRKYIDWLWLDRIIYKILDLGTDILSKINRFSFPDNYIRRWKLNMLWGMYEPETFKLFERIIKPGMVIVDIGAHIGYFTRLFSKLAGANGQIYALEADPENFSLLQKNTAHLKNVRRIRTAITDTRGEISFYRSEKTGCHSTIANATPQKEVITVPATDLDDLLMAHGSAPKIDIIKMDIEGGEMAALRGMTKIINANPGLALIVEFNPECLGAANVIPTDFIRALDNLGFKILSIQTDGLIEIDTEERMPEQYLLPGATFVNLYCVKR